MWSSWDGAGPTLRCRLRAEPVVRSLRHVARREYGCDCEPKSGQDFLVGNLIRRFQYVRIVPTLVDFHDSLLRVNDPNPLHACFEILIEFAFKDRGTIARTNHLDGQVWDDVPRLAGNGHRL